MPAERELVAAGAAVQAAAVLGRRSTRRTVAAEWATAAGRAVEPGPAAAPPAEVRAAYAARRDAEA